MVVTANVARLSALGAFGSLLVLLAPLVLLTAGCEVARPANTYDSGPLQEVVALVDTDGLEGMEDVVPIIFNQDDGTGCVSGWPPDILLSGVGGTSVVLADGAVVADPVAY
jgi:hypothetical protein